ncbi:thioredoxin [Corynebacterium tapiri]|uniref:Thioredoxin n=1 Tax=Corynebacterium tapiri TaxID=1448266 RepID=A0A5C4U2V3_9CORY|nr:thioredoxin [Corynebacterium tapiri]TNL96864.1 thioredoxin [Corynebacterium tapiri]
MAAGNVITVTQDTFRSEVTESEGVVLVDFWAEWCGPCKKLGPIVEELAEDFAGKARVAKVDVDSERLIAAMYQVMSIPTLMIFKDGQKVDEFAGLRSKAELAERLSAHL